MGGHVPETARGRMWFFGLGSAALMTMFLIGVGWWAFWLTIVFAILVGLDAWAVSTGREDLDEVAGTGGGEHVNVRITGWLWAKFVACSFIVTVILYFENTREFDVTQLMWIYRLVSPWWVKDIGWTIVVILAPIMLRWLAKLYSAYHTSDR